MGELVDRDQEHLKLLKVGYYVLAATAGFSTLFSLAFIAFGIALQTMSLKGGSAHDARVMGLVMLGAGLATLVLGSAMTYLTYYTARSIAAHRHWLLCMVLAGLWCLSIPYGTAIGIGAFLVLNRNSVKALFEATAKAETDHAL